MSGHQKTLNLMIYRRSRAKDPKGNFLKDKAGKLKWQVHQIGPSDPAFHFIAQCIDASIQALHTQKARDWMIRKANVIVKKHKQEMAGHIGSLSGAKNDREGREKCRQWVEGSFLAHLRDSYPPVYIDEQMTGYDIFAKHVRRREEGKYHSGMATLLPEPGVEYLVFAFSNILIHEVGGHLMVSHLLPNLREGTPEVIHGISTTSVKNSGSETKAPKRGESGVSIEKEVLGGELMWLNKSPIDFADPYILTSQRKSSKDYTILKACIPRTTVEKFVGHQFEFPYVYPPDGESKYERTDSTRYIGEKLVETVVYPESIPATWAKPTQVRRDVLKKMRDVYWRPTPKFSARLAEQAKEL